MDSSVCVSCGGVSHNDDLVTVSMRFPCGKQKANMKVHVNMMCQLLFSCSCKKCTKTSVTRALEERPRTPLVLIRNKNHW